MGGYFLRVTQGEEKVVGGISLNDASRYKFYAYVAISKGLCN